MFVCEFMITNVKRPTVRKRMLLAAAIGLALGMLIVTHLRPGVIPGYFWFDGIDKVFHVGVSSVLAVLLWHSLNARRAAVRIALAGGIPLALSALNEMTQPLIGRSCDIQDWLADLAGVCLGMIVCVALTVVGSRPGRRARCATALGAGNMSDLQAKRSEGVRCEVARKKDMVLAEQVNASPRSRSLAATVWLVILAALAYVYAGTFAAMWKWHWFPAWSSEELGLYDRFTEGESYYTHGPLVPVVSLVMIAMLIRHTTVKVRPSPVSGVLLLTLFLLFHVVACVADVQFIRGFICVGVVASLVVALWGWSTFRRFWFPIAFLVFMMPLAPVMISTLNFRLKMLSAELGVAVASISGILVEQSGSKIMLAGGKEMVVGSVCSGLRTLISLLAFGAIYCYVCRLRGWLRIGLFAMTVPVAIASNCMRIVALIVVARFWSVEVATGAFHDGSGVLIFVCAFLLMFGLEKLVFAVAKLVGRPLEVLPICHDVRRTEADESQAGALFAAAGGLRGSLVAALCILAAVGVWRASRPADAWAEYTIANALPTTVLVDGVELVGVDSELDAGTLRILQTNDYLCRTFGGGNRAPVEVMITYSQGNRRGIHPPDKCLEGGGQSIIHRGKVDVSDVHGRGDLECNEIIVQRGAGKTYFLYVYRCGDGYTANWYAQQLMIIGQGLRGRSIGGALIRISTPITDGVKEARERTNGLMRVAVVGLDENVK